MNRNERFNSRRGFLRASAVAIAASAMFTGNRLCSQDRDSTDESENTEKGKQPKVDRKCERVVLVYANGGPSQYETFDPKPGQSTGAPFKVIETDVKGFTPVEHLPQIAALASEFCLIKNMRSSTVDHAHARHLMHTGWLSNPTIVRPGLGNIVSHQLGNAESELPNFVKFGGSTASGGYLGSEHISFGIDKAGEKIRNLDYAPGVDKERMERRMKLVREMDDDFAEGRDDRAVKERRAAIERAQRLMESPLRDTFYLDDEPEQVWKAYGKTEFAKRCMVARRLLEAGVPAIEINLDGWDTHDDAFNRNIENCKTFDQPFAALIKDLKARGLLETTLVAWYGDFGRSPKLTATSGRGHSARNFCVLLAGGGVQGGQVIGATNEDGTELLGDSHHPRDLFATFAHLNGWQTEEQFQAGGRPTYLVDKDARAIKAVYGEA